VTGADRVSEAVVGANEWLGSCERGIEESPVSRTGVVVAPVEGSQFRRGLLVRASVAGMTTFLRFAGGEGLLVATVKGLWLMSSMAVTQTRVLAYRLVCRGLSVNIGASAPVARLPPFFPRKRLDLAVRAAGRRRGAS
jgi:hypothetical protein